MKKEEMVVKLAALGVAAILAWQGWWFVAFIALLLVIQGHL